MKLRTAGIIILSVLLIDQISKIYIKTHFKLGEEVEVFSWFRILFFENNGAAWGKTIPGQYGKLILSIFRICAIFGIGYWLWSSIKKKSPSILIVSIALIFAGALGNIIDSVFYGVIFDSSYDNIATFMSPNPYGTLLHGKVVPFHGGERFTFFEPVFNIADTAISIAVGLLIIFNKQAFKQ